MLWLVICKNSGNIEVDFILIFIIIILIVFVWDFSKIRDQNKKLIEQNDQIISLLENIKNQDKQ